MHHWELNNYIFLQDECFERPELRPLNSSVSCVDFLNSATAQVQE